eukprot:3931785-Pleurochrysis_carterae.AAC.1
MPSSFHKPLSNAEVDMLSALPDSDPDNSSFAESNPSVAAAAASSSQSSEQARSTGRGKYERKNGKSIRTNRGVVAAEHAAKLASASLLVSDVCSVD